MDAVSHSASLAGLLDHSYPTSHWHGRNPVISSTGLTYFCSIGERCCFPCRLITVCRPMPCTILGMINRAELTSACPGTTCSWAMPTRSEEHPVDLQTLMRISNAVYCLK